MTSPMNMQTKPTLVWSCGGGTQSVAIAALIFTGQLPKPDISIMVDTGRERSSTWRTYREVLKPNLASVGVDLVIVEKAKYAKVDLYTLTGDLVLPVFTETGKMPTFCSNEWKQRVARRYLREQGVEKCEQWLGYSCDELRRMKPSGVTWIRNVYPLIEKKMFREDCRSLVQSLGWFSSRSSCYMCSNMSDKEWLDIKTEDPADFEKACLEEDAVREKDAGFFFHGSRVPLREVVFKDEANYTLFCDSGFCFV